MALGDEAQPGRWYATNLVGVPAQVLASPTFNAHPVPLQIAGARATQRGLFALLERCATPQDASAVFEHFMSISFGLQRLEPEATSPTGAEARRWRTSYLKLLQGWGLDSCGAAAAVLKGWVESRFGLVPSFHRAPLAHFPSDAWLQYLVEKAQGRWNNNAIWQQLDLLFEFCQWSLARFQPLGSTPWVELWRGASAAEAQGARDRSPVRLNNIVSMSLTREAASCFGDWLLRLQVPLCKLVCYPGLLDTHVLDGEGEVLVLGGDYTAELRYD